MKTLLMFFCAVTLTVISALQLSAQDTERKVPIDIFVGASYTIAPTFDIDGRWTVNTNTSANFYSLFLDLVINDNLIGRVQTSFLSVSSLGDEAAEELTSGFEMNGSLGYRYHPEASKISIPIMATLGFATVKEENVRDAGMQVGGTVGLNYQFSSHVYGTSTFRYLRGVGFSDGSKIDQMDISLGVQLRL